MRFSSVSWAVWDGFWRGHSEFRRDRAHVHRLDILRPRLHRRRAARMYAYPLMALILFALIRDRPYLLAATVLLVACFIL